MNSLNSMMAEFPFEICGGGVRLFRPIMPQALKAFWSDTIITIHRRRDHQVCTASNSSAGWPHRCFMIIIADEAGSRVLIKMPASSVCPFGNHGTRRLTFSVYDSMQRVLAWSSASSWTIAGHQDSAMHRDTG